MRRAFGGRAQVMVGSFMATVTTVELIAWWTPTLQQVYIVSMEALYFAAYAVIATGLAFRATERVEAHVDPELDP